jgi:diguanylate cyclase (GGDEF)-like protein
VTLAFANAGFMQSRNRALLYAAAGAVLSLGEPIGLLVIRELYDLRPLTTELAAERVTYAYVFITTAVLLACVGYFIGRQADRLAALSETDPLTNLSNRRALGRRLADEVRRATRYREPVSLMLIDIDGLKRVNDEQGHVAGDRLIRRVGRAIAATLRASDMAARWGGDEFAIVMPNTHAEAAKRSAERLFEHLSTSDGSTSEPVTVSAGIATLDVGGRTVRSVEELTMAADEALYAAKAAGKNRVHAA